MKKFLTLVLAGIFVCAALPAQTPRYLTNVHKPVDSRYYKSGTPMEIYGGFKWNNGFSLGYESRPYQPGYATFRLDGKYETLMFVLGLERGPYGSEPRVVTVYADGRKILDEVVRKYDVHKRIKLDVKGVNELKFGLAAGEGHVCFAEMSLWKAGETPRETGNLSSGKPVKKMLMKDLLPYTMQDHSALEDSGHWIVSPDSKYKSVSVGNTKYNYGLLLMMNMALVGNNAAQTHFNLDGQYETFSFIAGPVNTESSSNGVGWIIIKGDGKILHEYEVRQDDIARRITLDVTGVRQLSVFSEQSDMSLYGAIVDAWVYPAGEVPYAEQESSAGEADPRLKALPDVCKLISNIPPYSVRGQVDHQVYTGESDHITFSMGGTRFSEGFILYEKADFWDDNLVSYAAFDLGNEFDYVSFTAGYVGTSWIMNNDRLMVYADEELILSVPLKATYPNQKFVIPINKCRKLRFENGGQGTMNVGAYGVADLVVYRGEPVENDLFVHPVPECPDEIDLIDLGKPYIHYVTTARSGAFHDGSTQRQYFTMPDGSKLYKGFMLQTNSHFSLDHGIFHESGDAMAGVIGATAVGSAFVASSVAVGGAVVGSTLMGVAAFMVLAAGGEAVENSCAAFNTYGQYNSLTFTVAMLKTAGDSQFLGEDTWQRDIGEYKETLLIGADQTVVAELAVFENMEPQTITVPINGCEQLMFWLANTNGNSAQYVFYDLKLSREKCELAIPEDARQTKPVVTKPVWSPKQLANTWERQKSSGAKYIDEYFHGLTITREKTLKYLQDYIPEYDICTYYLETDAGQFCKAVKLRYRSQEDDSGSLLPSSSGSQAALDAGYYSITDKHSSCSTAVVNLAELKNSLISLSMDQANAYLDLPSLGLGALGYGKLLKQSSAVLKEMKEVVDAMYNEKKAEYDFLHTIIGNAIDIDGRKSYEKTVFCPLFPGEVMPEGDKMMARNFAM